MIELVPFNPKAHVTDAYLNALNSRQAKYLWTGNEIWDGISLKQWLKKTLTDPNQKMFAIESDGIHIGNIKITFDAKNRSVNYGRLFWDSGTGKGTEALKALINYVFSGYPGVEIITDMAASTNPASIISNLKAGMRIRGVWKDKLCIDGKRVDGVAVGITREEWEEP